MKDIRNILASKTKQALSSNLLNADSIRKNIIILDELKELIPPLMDEEFAQLEKNILEHGCQTPLQVWQTTKAQLGLPYNQEEELAYVLIDGHNRHRICTQHNRPFEVYMLFFPSIKEAKDYMIDLQLGRRNLTTQQSSYLRGLRYNNEKVDKNSNLKAVLSKGQTDPSGNLTDDSEAMPKGQSDPSGISTAERLAKEYKVSAKTIKRDAEFAKGLDKLDITLRNEVLKGTTKVDKNVIQKIGKSTDLLKPIGDIETLMKLTTDNEVVEKVNPQNENIERQANELINLSKKFAKSKSKADLEEIIRLAQEAIEQLN